MTTRLSLLLALLLTLTAASAKAADPEPDPLGDLSFNPELVLRFADDLKLTDEQRATLEPLINEAQSQHEKTRAKRVKQATALAKSVEDKNADQETIDSQLLRVLNSEREMKRVHLDLMFRITRTLEPAQRAKLQEIKNFKPMPPEIQERFQTKMEKIRDEVEFLQSAGLPPYEVIGLIQTLDPILKARDYKKAESIIDEAMTLLELDKKGK